MVSKKLRIRRLDNLVGFVGFQKVIDDLQVFPKDLRLVRVNRHCVSLHYTVNQICGLVFQVEFEKNTWPHLVKNHFDHPLS